MRSPAWTGSQASPILFLAQIAFIVAFGVLLDTFVVRTLLVPAAAIDMGWFTWWPVRPEPTRHQLAAGGSCQVTADSFRGG